MHTYRNSLPRADQFILGFGLLMAGLQPAFAELPVSAVTASQNPLGAEKTRDGSLAPDSRWSAQGAGQWIQYDLGAPARIGSADISFYQGDKRTTRFALLVGTSEDQLSEVYRGDSSGLTLEFERFDLADQTAQYLRIVGYGNSVNDWIALTEVNIHEADTDDGSTGDGPFSGAPVALPGTLEAEHYDHGRFSDTSPGNSGGALRDDAVDIEASTSNGHNIGWIEAGEWLEYSVDVAEAGSYTMSSLVAGPAAGGRFEVLIDGARATEFNVPATGGWQNWSWVDQTVELGAGKHTLRIDMKASGFNLNAFVFTRSDDPVDPPAVNMLWGGANHPQISHQSTEQRRRQLQAMKDAGLKVLRVFVAMRPYEPWQIEPQGWVYEDPLGVFHDDQLNRMDELMKECEEMGIKMILALANFAYAEENNRVYHNAFGAVGMYQQAAIDAYKRRFSHFLNHRNPYMNNQKWKDLDDVVLAWEVANEPGVSLSETSLSEDEKYRINRNFLTPALRTSEV